jgi:hypothetical protein
MGKVSEYLSNLVTQQVKDNGIVIWFDPDQVYTQFVENLSIPKTKILRYEDSFFRLREQIEPFLEFVGQKGKVRHDCGVPPRLLVYLPLERQKTQYALVELENAGVVLEPGATPWQRNTRLRVIAEQVFKKIAPDSVGEIARQVEEGILTLEDLDRLSMEAAGLATSTIKIIFGTAGVVDVALYFVSSNGYDQDILSKQALPELVDFFFAELGIQLDKKKGLGEIRKSFRRIILITDLLSPLPERDKPKELKEISIPDKKDQIEKVRHICQVWRNRMDLREAYVSAADIVQKELDLSSSDFPGEKLADLETFSFIEKKLLHYAEHSLLDGKAEKVLPLSERRRQSFWPLQEPAYLLHWSLLVNSAQVLLLAEKIRKDLKKIRDPELMIKNYVEDPEDWSRLDRVYRHLEAQYSNFDLDLKGRHDQLEKVIIKIRQEYTRTVEQEVEAFTTAYKGSNFLMKGFLPQSLIFEKGLKPLIKTEGKTAYILVDALRFEMGRELVEGLKDEFEVEVLPAIAQLPTLTLVGMAALLPNAEKGLKLSEAPGGKMAISFEDGVLLKDRLSRVKYFEDHIDRKVVVFKLNELLKPSKKQKALLEEAGIVLVTSQEIDRWGEEVEDESEARIIMEEVLDKLRKGIRRLASLGITHFVVTADHGHLFGETLDSAMKMEPPGGKILELHRRVWIGKGGNAAEGYIRVSASALGLDGDFELAFPKSLACFKAKGGSLSYFHGGISLQEMVIPFIKLKAKEVQPYLLKTRAVQLTMDKPKITTRFFSITATYVIEGLQLGPEEVRVRAVVRANRKDIGFAATAAYGFEEGTREIVLKKDNPNAITFMLTDISEVDELSVHVLDAVSQMELAQKEHIPLVISF